MIRAYRALLRLYPAGFRREYGVEMTAMFAERSAAVGPLGRIVLLLRAVPDVFANAALLHWELLRQDLRYTARTLRRAPGFALTAILVIALGVGANTAAFSVADYVLIRPLAFGEPESLVRLCEGPRTGPSGWGCMNQLSPANYRDFKEQTTSFEALGAFRRDAINVVDGGEPQRLPLAVVTPEVLPLLRVPTVIGTMFDADSDNAETRSVVISYGLWQSRFGGDPRVLGRTLNLDGTPHVVIGVMPASFHFPSRDVQLWTQLQLVEEDYVSRGNNYLEAVGRLAPGVTFEQARADLDVVAERLARAYPDTNEETGVSFFLLRDEYSPRFRLILRALCGASLCILLLACANLGNLLLARAGTRQRELAVRAALGAGRERLIRQMMTESIVLAALGGVGGVLIASIAFPLLALLIPTTLPIGSEPGLNLRVLGLAALFTAVTGVAFGLVPAIRTGGRAALEALRGGRAAARKQRMRAVLVGVEVAAAVVLLASSGLMIRALLRVQNTDPGFDAEGVLTLRTVLPKPSYLDTDKRERFYRTVLAEIRQLPGVQGAAYTSGVPMIMWGGIMRVTLPGQEVRRDANYMVMRRYVTPQFFRALGVPLISGRDFEDFDADARSRVGVVSESFAQRYWPNEDPLGKSFLFMDSIHTVIGVVGDIKFRGLERVSEPQLWLPTTRVGEGLLSYYDPKDLIIRTGGSPTALVPAVREIIRRVDPEQPVSDIMTLEDVLALQTTSRTAQVQILLVLAVLAVLIAGLGIHGLLAYTVSQQRQEIGVRLALGEAPARVARRVLGSGVFMVLLGMAPGLLVALWAGRAMSTMLFGVPAADPMTFVITIVLCLGMAITGASLPAWRAVRVSPMSVMRME